MENVAEWIWQFKGKSQDIQKELVKTPYQMK